ncbi:MAG TPA: hypothetical protein DEB52_16915, partial [Hyphomonas sp.]|nr:hypothetical protein [Hyphomonas sp.]
MPSHTATGGLVFSSETILLLQNADHDAVPTFAKLISQQAFALPAKPLRQSCDRLLLCREFNSFAAKLV